MPQERYLPRDLAAQGVDARFRLMTSLLGLGAALWLSVERPSWFSALFLILALLLALFRIASLRRLRRERQQGVSAGLHLDEHGFRILRGDQVERSSWAEVKQLSLDEEKLSIRVERAEGAIWVEPLYGGMSLAELFELFLDYRRACRIEGEALE